MHNRFIIAVYTLTLPWVPEVRLAAFGFESVMLFGLTLRSLF